MFDKKDTERINGLYTDFLSDVIAAAVVDNGFDADRVIVKRRSGSERQTDKEVDSVEYKPDYEGNGDDILLIKTNRRGIYDNLPEGLFHTPSSLRDRSKENIINTFRRQNRDEFFVRRFFSLYEAEVERSRLDIRLTELRYDRPAKHRAWVDTLARLWPVISRMDSLTAVLFVRTIPHIAEIRNSYAKTSEALTMILGYPVRIERENKPVWSDMKFPRLGAMCLGVNSVLKGARVHAFSRVIIQAPEKAIDGLVPSGDTRGVVETLLDIYMPDVVNLGVEIRPESAARTSRMGGRLGVNMKLKDNDRYES